jgi:Cof subfamily protein (haloacid dehalogenase superfamily)
MYNMPARASMGVIFDPNLEVLSEHPLRDVAIQEIVGLIEAHGLDPWIYTDKQWYVTKSDATHVRHEANVVRFAPKLFDTLDEVERPIIKITGVSDRSDAIIACQNQLSQKFGNRLSLSCSLPNRLEVSHQDANKGTAIDAIRATMNIGREQIATAGDGENDIMMFRNSGFSIAMGQASAEVRRSASETTIANSQDGLAWAIDEFLLKRHT